MDLSCESLIKTSYSTFVLGSTRRTAGAGRESLSLHRCAKCTVYVWNNCVCVCLCRGCGWKGRTQTLNSLASPKHCGFNANAVKLLCTHVRSTQKHTRTVRAAGACGVEFRTTTTVNGEHGGAMQSRPLNSYYSGSVAVGTSRVRREVSNDR